MSNDKDFHGIGWSFPPQFSKSQRGVVMLRGMEDIESSLKIIFDTLPGERVMRPDVHILSWFFERTDSNSHHTA
jgi:uncharacterized protein